MKKLLLVALLATGATACAAVEGTANNVELPIVATGEVVAATSNLMIEATTAGMKGDEMKFDFGKIAAGRSSKAMDGTFKIVRSDAKAFNTNSATAMKVGLDTTGANKTATTTLTQGSGDITINYSVSIPNIDMASKEATGTVTASASVATGVDAGLFSDRSQKVYVIVTPGP